MLMWCFFLIWHHLWWSVTVLSALCVNEGKAANTFADVLLCQQDKAKGFVETNPNLLWPEYVITCHPHLGGAHFRDSLWQQAYRKTINQERILASEAKHMTEQTHGGLVREGGRDRQKRKGDRGTEMIQVTRLLMETSGHHAFRICQAVCQ